MIYIYIYIYTKAVLVITGIEDNIFCNPTGTETTPGYCRATDLNETRALYPSSSSYTWISVPNAGHCWQLHYAAPAAFETVYAWLVNVGF